MFDLFVSFVNSAFGWFSTAANGTFDYIVAAFNGIANFLSGN